MPITSARAVMGPPEQRCWVEKGQVSERHDLNVPGAIIGGVLGGILGHQVGGGTGKTVATIGGAVGGGALGANVDRIRDPQSGQDVKRCETVAGQTPQYWDVTYNFGGVEHRVQMTTRPGATIEVNGQGRKLASIESGRPSGRMPINWAAIASSARSACYARGNGATEASEGRRRYCGPMSPLVLVKLFAIFAVVAIGWAVEREAGAGSAAAILRGGHRRRRVLHLRSALLFRTTARTDFARVDVRVVLAFFVPTVVVLLLAYATLRIARGASADKATAATPSVRAITASFGNSVQIGIPLAAALYGEGGLALHVTLVSLHSLVLLTILTALVELDLAQARRRTDANATHLLATLATTARNTIVHPVVLPVLAGLAWNASGLALPAFADEILATLGQAVVPLCLVLIGVSLAPSTASATPCAARIAMSALKLVVQPLAVLAFARGVLGLGGVPRSPSSS